MTTTDTDALTERIARTLYRSDGAKTWDREGEHFKDLYRMNAAAVLPLIAAAREAVPALLDALAAAEARATRAEAQSAIRGRAVAIHRERGRVAEAERDQAYEWADGQSYPLVMRQGEILTGVANALNGPTPPLTSWSHHDLAEKAAEMVARAERAEARVKAVRDIHTGTVWPGVADKPICDACDQPWPCATTRALEG